MITSVLKGPSRSPGLVWQAADAPAAPVPAPSGRNFSAAAALRARLLGAGKPGPAASSPAPAQASGAGGAAGRRETVALPMVDAAGRAVRGAFGREAADAGTLDMPNLKPNRVNVCRKPTTGLPPCTRMRSQPCLSDI